MKEKIYEKTAKNLGHVDYFYLGNGFDDESFSTKENSFKEYSIR